jgi:hypothetical protein
MPRIDCAGCGKQHNREDKAAACRAKKASAITRARPDNTSRVMVTAARVAAPDGSSLMIPLAIRHGRDARVTMREYVARQSRDNAVGGTV